MVKTVLYSNDFNGEFVVDSESVLQDNEIGVIISAYSAEKGNSYTVGKHEVTFVPTKPTKVTKDNKEQDVD